MELRRDELIALCVAERDAELRGAGAVRVVEWPDRSGEDGPTVELIAADDTGEIAIEHTRIESYENQTGDRAALDAMFPGGGPRLDDRPNAVRFRLGVPIGSLAALGRSQRKQVAAVLTEWVREHLDQVPTLKVPGQPSHLTGSDDRVPFLWTLDCHITDDLPFGVLPGCIVAVSFGRPSDLEGRRNERSTRALGAKMPKLETASAGGRRRTILVVEGRDHVLANPADISRGFAEAMLHQALSPDVIYLLSTRAGDPTLYPLWSEAGWAHEIGDFRLLSFSAERTMALNAAPDDWV